MKLTTVSIAWPTADQQLPHRRRWLKRNYRENVTLPAFAAAAAATAAAAASISADEARKDRVKDDDCLRRINLTHQLKTQNRWVNLDGLFHSNLCRLNVANLGPNTIKSFH